MARNDRRFGIVPRSARLKGRKKLR